MGAPEVLENVKWTDDPYWKNRKLSPAQLLVHDIRIEAWKHPTTGSAHQEPILELTPILSSSLLPDLQSRNDLSEALRVEDLTSNRHEQTQIKGLVDEYGWMNTLRGQGVQQNVDDSKNLRKCRWM
jgi:hypothetical protein